MVALEKEKYKILIEPLKNIRINALFARSVIEKKVSGKMFVDNIVKPTTFYIIHPYGMSLLYGNSKNIEFNLSFKKYALNNNKQRNDYEWMQAYPKEWNEVLKGLFNDCIIKSSENNSNYTKRIIELNTRVNFKFNLIKYNEFKERFVINDVTIVRTTSDIFEKMEGSVVPKNFWNNADEFYNKGVGFSLFYKGKLAATAYSAFIFDNELELGMETIPKFRGKGFALYVCFALIDYCIENNYEPIWACKYENIPSYKLALKLGFEPNLTLPYYRLSK